MPEHYQKKHDSYLEKKKGLEKSKRMNFEEVTGRLRELSGQRKDGSIFPMEISVGESHASGERMYTGVVRDISKQKEAEAVKKEFISTVSHELRTPLTSIKGSLGLLASNKMGVTFEGKALELLDVSLRNIDRLALLINDILDFEKLEADALELELSVKMAGDILRDAVQVNEHYASNHQVKFEIEEPEIELRVEVDSNRIAQVLANLLSNAVKFSPSGSTVTVSLQRKRERVRFSVADKGSGIPESFRNRIFNRFTQNDSSDARKQGGTGLGMAISKAIVEKHNGRINYISELGNGSTFYFDLPEYLEEQDRNGGSQGS